jgi:hypothetical protein
MRNKLKSLIKKFLIFLFLFFCLNYPNGVIFSKESFSESNPSLKVGISYLSLRKSFVYLPVAWKSRMMTEFLGYEMTNGKFWHSIEISYGKGAVIDVNGKRKEGDSGFTLLDFTYDFVWHKLRPAGEQKFFWGFGVSIHNSEVKQKIRVASGKYNEHKDEYFGFGPRFNSFYKFLQGKFLTGFDLSLTTTLPGLSSSIIKTESVYSDKSYLLWVKLKTEIYCDYKLSRIYTFKFLFKRETWIYGRKQQPQYELHDFFSGGAYLLNSFGLNLSYNF